MRKNLVMRIAAVVLMCTLVTACFASSTFAKYTSQATSNTSTATVAKWSIKVDGKEIAVNPAPTVTFNVFDTILDTGYATETDVNTGRIAPGTTGYFNIDKIKNNSEVSANIVVKVKSFSNASNIPLVFATDSAFENVITIADAAELINQNVAAGDTIAAQTIYWKWTFEDGTSGTDASDTALGIAAQTSAPTYNVTLELVATQLD